MKSVNLRGLKRALQMTQWHKPSATLLAELSWTLFQDGNRVLVAVASRDDYFPDYSGMNLMMLAPEYQGSSAVYEKCGLRGLQSLPEAIANCDGIVGVVHETTLYAVVAVDTSAPA